MDGLKALIPYTLAFSTVGFFYIALTDSGNAE